MSPASIEQNKQTVRTWIEQGWNGANPAIADHCYTEGVVQHDPSSPFPVEGREALKQYCGLFLGAMPDLRFSIAELLGEADRVVWRFVATGTQQGPLGPIPATGRPIMVHGLVVFRMEHARIAEVWVNYDALGLYQQLGVIPQLGA